MPLSGHESQNRDYFRSVASLGYRLAEAIAYAHSQRVLHRDIKPSNLLLDHQGNCWITDFGLAKPADGDALTQSGDIVGTLRYMAPEQLRGKSNPAVDVYGLGVTLYEMLTLRPAFDDNDHSSVIRKISDGSQVTSPRAINRAIPPDLESAIPGHV